MQELEYNTDPEQIDEGEEIEPHFSICAKCHGRIYQPILKGIWYHRDSYTGCTSAEFADNFTQLFLQFEDGNGTLLKIDEYDDKEYLACPCYLKWFKLLTKGNVAGFSGDCYFDTDGISLCGIRLIGISNEPITEMDFPEKRGYLCNDCISVLEKRKIIKLIPQGKKKNPIFSKIEWLKK